MHKARTTWVHGCAAVLAATLFCTTARGTVVFFDGFGDGDRDNNGVAEAPVTDPTDVGGAWYKAGSGTSAMTFQAIDDSAGIGTGNALQLANTGGNNRPVQSHFTPVTLNDGDSIVYKFDMRVVSFNAAADRLFRFGLYNDGGTYVTGDQGSGDTTYNDDLGYNARVDIGADAPGGTLDVTRDDSAGGTILNGTATSISTSTSNTVDQIVDANKHHMQLTLTRSGTAMLITLQEDSNPAVTGTDASPVPSNFTFNEVDFSTRSAQTLDLRFDNVEVDYVAAPEPSSLVLCGAAALSLLSRRRDQRGV